MTNESLNVSDFLSADCGSVEQSSEDQFLAKLGADGRPCCLGVMGGTFDPIHNGHLEIARRACESLGLSGVLFVVAGDPWMKHGRALTPAEDRFAMVQAAIEGDVRFAASRREIDRVGETYTVDTLRALHARGERALYLIVGTDMLLSFDRIWRAPEEIVRLSTLAVCARDGDDWDALADKAARLRQTMNAKIEMVRGESLTISSTELRQGGALRRYTPPAVADYIERNHLYGY